MRVLGISPEHDSSVAIIEDGKVLAYYKEERLSRIKRDNTPWNSLLKAVEDISRNNLTIDYVTLASPSPNDEWNPYVTKFIQKIVGAPLIDYSNKHHLCHASLSFYNSGFNKALVFVLDRDGSPIDNIAREAESVYLASYPSQFKILQKNYWMFGLGLDIEGKRRKIIEKYQNKFEINLNSSLSITKVYESATTLIGQSALENGKTMGLAPYGQSIPLKLYNNNFPIDNLFIHDNFIEKTFNQPLYYKYLDKISKEIPKDNHSLYSNYAYEVQSQTQQQVLNLVKKWVEKTGINKVCFGGGYALNVVTNYFLIKSMPEIKFYFEPLSDDSGNSIGSALHLYRKKTKDKRKYILNSNFLGEKVSNEILKNKIDNYV